MEIDTGNYGSSLIDREAALLVNFDANKTDRQGWRVTPKPSLEASGRAVVRDLILDGDWDATCCVNGLSPLIWREAKAGSGSRSNNTWELPCCTVQECSSAFSVLLPICRPSGFPLNPLFAQYERAGSTRLIADIWLRKFSF
ncbi:hypothetical protein [Gluconobacter japonicus]|uniref:hypothetical protein n=1 Tax=Gluconobacter japonicus TaxID=376620 RepID=UPI0039EB8FE2